MHYQSRVSTTTIHELLFVDDCTQNTTTEGGMQRSMDLFPAACENFDPIVNTQKTVFMHQPPPNTAPHDALHVIMNEVQLQVVDNFMYLSSTLSRSTKIDDKVFQDQSDLPLSSKHCLESSWSPAEHETEDVHGRHTPDIAAWSRDLDGVHEAGARAPPLLPYLSPTDTADENHWHLRHA
nr:unnamed protein product [Spirometra erinaceieuropaei]